MVSAKIHICQKNKGRNEFGVLEIASVVACLPDDDDHSCRGPGGLSSFLYQGNQTLFEVHFLEEEL